MMLVLIDKDENTQMAQAKDVCYEVGFFSGNSKVFKRNQLKFDLPKAECSKLEVLSLNGRMDAKTLESHAKRHKNSSMWSKLLAQLEAMPELKRINFRDNNIEYYTQDDVLGFAAMIQGCQQLISLDLTGNTILSMPTVRFRTLISALQKMPNLQELLFDDLDLESQQSPDHQANLKELKDKLFPLFALQQFRSAARSAELNDVSDTVLENLQQASQLASKNVVLNTTLSDARKALSAACAEASKSGDHQKALTVIDKLLCLTPVEQLDYVKQKRAVIESNCVSQWVNN